MFRTATLVASLMLAAPVAAFAAPATDISRQPEIVETTPAPVAQPAQAVETSSYAEREARDVKVQNYEGGATVVIAMSGTALVVLLIILLLL